MDTVKQTLHIHSKQNLLQSSSISSVAFSQSLFASQIHSPGIQDPISVCADMHQSPSQSASEINQPLEFLF